MCHRCLKKSAGLRRKGKKRTPLGKVKKKNVSQRNKRIRKRRISKKVTMGNTVKEKTKIIKNRNIIRNPLLREVVIDACNVGHNSSGSGFFDFQGVLTAIEYFQTRGHIVYAFLPITYLGRIVELFQPKAERLKDSGVLVIVPGRKVDGKKMYCNDDKMIIGYASIKGAVILSNDEYKQYMGVSELFKKTITERLLRYHFDGELLIPEDPQGNSGLSWEQYLKF